MAKAPPRRPGAGGARMTLGQASGGRPRPPARGGAAPPPPRAASPRPPAAPKSLGLGLGLGAKQRAGFQQAAKTGTSGQYLAAHPGIQQKIQNRVPAGGNRQTKIQNFMGTGASQRRPLQRPGGMPRPPTRGVPLSQRPRPAQPLGGYPVNQGMQSVLNSRWGQGMASMPPGSLPKPNVMPGGGGGGPMFQGDRSQGTGDQLTPYGQQQLGGMGDYGGRALNYVVPYDQMRQRMQGMGGQQGGGPDPMGGMAMMGGYSGDNANQQQNLADQAARQQMMGGMAGFQGPRTGSGIGYGQQGGDGGNPYGTAAYNPRGQSPMQFGGAPQGGYLTGYGGGQQMGGYGMAGGSMGGGGNPYGTAAFNPRGQSPQQFGGGPQNMGGYGQQMSQQAPQYRAGFVPYAQQMQNNQQARPQFQSGGPMNPMQGSRQSMGGQQPPGGGGYL